MTTLTIPKTPAEIAQISTPVPSNWKQLLYDLLLSPLGAMLAAAGLYYLTPHKDIGELAAWGGVVWQLLEIFQSYNKMRGGIPGNPVAAPPSIIPHMGF